MKRFTIILFPVLFFAGLSLRGQTPGRGASERVVVRTSQGKIVLALYDDTPLHRDNFVKLVDSGFYRGILFHRAIRGFVIQAGDPHSKEGLATKVYGEGEIGYRLPAEITQNAYHTRGALGAAREPDRDNPRKESSGSHFYIVQGAPVTDSMLDAAEERLGAEMPPEVRELYRRGGGVPRLDGGYTVFGYVVKGMKTVDRIAGRRTDEYDRPLQDVFIRDMKVKHRKKRK